MSMPTDASCTGHPQDGCITCGDVAVELHVRGVDASRGLALCADADGVTSTVEIGLVDPVAVGDALLVHAGTAIGHTTGGTA